jgi:bacterioferritin (cytochrome b1)
MKTLCWKGMTPKEGEPRLIETLKSLLADGLTAINQYIVHSGMAALGA